MTSSANACSITVENAVLKYPIGPFIKGSLKSSLFRLVGHKDHQAPAAEFYTALKGVSFSIKEGERVAIIGRNGAGKSTILRAMAGIYPLEQGKIEVKGQIQSLFEIGMGFEMESTGRENIFYRGLAMGCDRKTIEEREQDIIAFADIGDFIDLPIRMYSAGMFVRLAFGISTYLEGQVLLIDEVFGAGDAAFRDKAIKRMHDMLGTAKIVVFVSHEVSTVKDLCERTIWLDHGVIRRDGPSAEVIQEYLAEVTP
jgi:lipopolysaccharide transport system ATP-binding protein